MSFNINDRVSVKYRNYINEVDNYYSGTIVDIEECHEYDEETLRRRGIKIEENPLVKTGRYGIKFDINPTRIEIPYFWESEITLLD